MKDLVRTYNLLVSNNFPEEAFIKKYGQELFDKLKNEAFAIDRGRCAGCGHEPPEHKKSDCLIYHIYEVNSKNPELTKGVTLCKGCHATQHIENSIKNKWVLLVNSVHDQSNLIRLSRWNQIYGAQQQRLVVQLRKTPEQFLKEWYAGEVKFTPTLKVIFTENFNLNDL
jgi:hypothetical protein